MLNGFEEANRDALFKGLNWFFDHCETITERNLERSHQHRPFRGDQAEAMLEWPLDRRFTFTADYAHFFAGEFLEQTTPGQDVAYFSAWITSRC